LFCRQLLWRNLLRLEPPAVAGPIWIAGASLIKEIPGGKPWAPTGGLRGRPQRAGGAGLLSPSPARHSGRRAATGFDPLPPCCSRALISCAADGGPKALISAELVGGAVLRLAWAVRHPTLGAEESAADVDPAVRFRRGGGPLQTVCRAFQGLTRPVLLPRSAAAPVCPLTPVSCVMAGGKASSTAAPAEFFAMQPLREPTCCFSQGGSITATAELALGAGPHARAAGQVPSASRF